MNTLTKKRTSFVYRNQAYMIESIGNIEGKPTFLRAEATTSDAKVLIPPFIKVIKDVTSEKLYSSPTLAHVDFKYKQEQFGS
jgi:hypothetical protein